MRKLILIVWSLISVASLWAQQMQVADFHLDPTDQTANREGTKRISKQDGRPAALLKIVAPVSGFVFDGGQFYSVDDPIIQPDGEVWIYIPARSTKINIAHARLGRLDYTFPVAIESAKTYRMQIDPGVGRFVNINASQPRSVVYVDGDSVGLSPILKTYLMFGPHTLTARNGRHLGTTTINVENDGSNGALDYTIEMIDQTPYYGKVVLEAEPDAEIWMDGHMLGVGKWTGELMRGNYVAETRRVNCDPANTNITVVPQVTSTIALQAPVPYKGYLNVFTRPQNSIVEIAGQKYLGGTLIEMPVGTYSVDIKHKDYDTKQKEYALQRNVTINDTVNLQHIQYIKPMAFYFGAGFEVGPFMGPNALIGGRWRNIDLQLGIMWGLNKTDQLNYYNVEDGTFQGTAQYTMMSVSAKVGYQIAFSPFFGLTPQVGFATHTLYGSVVRGAVPSEGLTAACATVGARFMYAPMRHVTVFAAPEYAIAVSKGTQYTMVVDAVGRKTQGIYCNVGIMINF